MNALWCVAATCAVALLYDFYDLHRQALRQRRRRLRERVAYMLWVMAERGGSSLVAR
jgi:hypothetical protein